MKLHLNEHQTADIGRNDLTEALVRWRRGDHMMALFYLDRAGFHGIEALFGQIMTTVSA